MSPRRPYTGRREARRHHALRLLEDVGEEQVGGGRVALEDRVRIGHGRAHDRRGRHGDRPRVAGRHRRGRRAVCRVEDRGGRILGARQLELERLGLVPVRHAERHLRREAAAPVAVRRARRRLREVEQLLIRHVPDDLGRKEERRVAGRIVEARHLERVLARAYERQRDVEEGRRQRVLRRPRAGGGDGDELRAVQARGEAVRVADAQPELLARGRRRVQRERPAPVGGRGRAGHSRREVRRHVRAQRPRMRHPGGCRAHEAERRGAEILLALRHAEVERGAAALLEVDELHVVRAGLRQVERGRGLPVAARAPVLPRPGFLQTRDLRREAVVGPDGERPQPGLRHPDRSGHHHHEVVPAHARERGVRREGFVLERDRRADVRHGIAGVPLGAVAEVELGGVHRVHGHVHRVRHNLEAAGRAGHAHGSGNRSPGPVADLVFGGGIAVQQRLGEVSVSERHVVHLLSEGVLGDDRPVGRREADSLAARGKAERRMDVARIPIRERGIQIHHEVAVRGHDGGAGDLLPFRENLRRVVRDRPAGDVDVEVGRVADLHPVERGHAARRVQDGLVGRHDLVDAQDVRREDGDRPPFRGQLHRFACGAEGHCRRVEHPSGGRLECHDHPRPRIHDVDAVRDRDVGLTDLDGNKLHAGYRRYREDGRRRRPVCLRRKRGQLAPASVAHFGNAGGTVGHDDWHPLAAVSRQGRSIDDVAHLRAIDRRAHVNL